MLIHILKLIVWSKMLIGRCKKQHPFYKTVRLNPGLTTQKYCKLLKASNPYV